MPRSVPLILFAFIAFLMYLLLSSCGPSVPPPESKPAPTAVTAVAAPPTAVPTPVPTPPKAAPAKPKTKKKRIRPTPKPAALKPTSTPTPPVTTSAKPAAKPIQVAKKTEASEEAFHDYWYFGVGAGLSVPSRNWTSNYTLGLGGKLIGGYAWDRNWAVQADVQVLSFSPASNSAVIGSLLYFYPTYLDFRLLPEVKRYFNAVGDAFRPYALVGGGVGLESATYQTGQSRFDVYLDGMAGAGAQLDFDEGTGLFLEGKCKVAAYPSGKSLGWPIEMGVVISLR